MDFEEQLFLTFDFKYNKKYRYKKLFTKLDLHWKYNNVQIKEGDKWKMVFMTPKDCLNQ